MQGNAGFDHIIKKNFEGDIQFKRVKKEIQLLKDLDQGDFKISLQNSVLGLKIVIELSRKLLKEKIQELAENTAPVVFEILLENKYPFIFPKVTCLKTREVFGKINDKFALQSYGAYHLGHTYNLEDFLSLDTVTCFTGTELLSNSKASSRYLMLTDCSLLNFEIVDSKKSLLKLVSWANLQSLLNITRRKEEENTLVLTWKDSQKKDGVLQILNIENSVKFLSELIKNMKTFGVKVNKNIIKQPDLTIEDVTIKAYEQVDIDDLIAKAQRLERKLDTSIELVLVKELMACYQSIIEYFSAVDDQRFNQYLKKLHQFLNREEISRELKRRNSHEQIKEEHKEEPVAIGQDLKQDIEQAPKEPEIIGQDLKEEHPHNEEEEHKQE